MQILYSFGALALVAGANGAAAARPKEHGIFRNIFEGPGLMKGFQIDALGNERVFKKYQDFSVEIAFNGKRQGGDNFVYRLQNTQRRTYEGRTRFFSESFLGATFCTEEAVEQDLDGFLCGKFPIVLPSQHPILSFNGNDMLILRVKIDGVETVIDTFGNDSGKNFKICGRKNANTNSILTRKANVKRGQRAQLSARTPCEWDYEPLTIPFQFKPFSVDYTWSKPVDRSIMTLYGGSENDPEEFFLSAPNVDKIRVKDLEKGKLERAETNSRLQICIKQDTYILDQESKCHYLWDVDLGATDPETGAPIPFTFTVSGKFKGNVQRFLVDNSGVVLSGLSPRECVATQENPIDTTFNDYNYNFTCYDDCNTLTNQWNREAECVVERETGFRNPENNEWIRVPGGVNVSSCRYKPRDSEANLPQPWTDCDVDGQCNEEQFCTLTFGERCNDRVFLIKARSNNAENMVIPAGETRIVNFYIDTYYGSVGQKGRIHFITSAIADLSYEVTLAPSSDVVGSSQTLSGSMCEAAEEGATTYYRQTTSIYLQSDDSYSGYWNYSVTNEGIEDVTLLGVFKDFDTRWD